ncbi:gamma-glutamyl-gamma-aminobutyrate hydrolase family protein [Kocuria sp. cx-455]|uniref:gamma-glutamyl-gamma-aminobutyrate hydrolase family protein n=1 Tax=Kocuria sp. cx-455 TaxID=2771377 RepID=UPI003D7318C1
MQAHPSVPLLSPADVAPRSTAEPDSDVRIAVVAQLNLPDQNEETYELIKRFTSVTLESLREAGAQTVLIDVTEDAEPNYQAIAATDGVVVLGGGDVAGALYGHHEPVPDEYGKDPRSDRRQLKIIREAIDRDATVLAICRGSQLLNVACGGTLIPDIQPAHLHRGVDGAPMFLDEEIALIPGSKVHEIYGRERLVVRSGHHQAVAELGEGLRAIAVADDGVVEGTELVDKTWIVGVQWHPEDDDGRADDRYQLFNAFTQQARARKIT